MHNDARRCWAWLLSGALLDPIVVLAVAAFAPSLLQDRVWRVALLSSVLTLVHLVLLPALIWPAHSLSSRDLNTALARIATVPPAAFLGIMTGLAANFGLVLFLLPVIGAVGFLPLTHAVRDALGRLFVLAWLAMASFAGGAVCCGLVARGAIARARPGQIPVYERTAIVGGGIAAAVFGSTPGVSGASWLLPLLIALAGVPHLLLMCRDLARDAPPLAALPVAVSRLLVLVTALGASSGLLLLLRALHS